MASFLLLEPLWAESERDYYLDSVVAVFEGKVLTSVELRYERAIFKALFYNQFPASNRISHEELLKYLPLLVQEILIDRQGLSGSGLYQEEIDRAANRFRGVVGDQKDSFLLAAGLGAWELDEVIARKVRASLFREGKRRSMHVRLTQEDEERKMSVDQKREELYERWIERLLLGAHVTYLTDSFQ